MALIRSPPPISLGSQSFRNLPYTALPKISSCVFQQKKTTVLKYGDWMRKTNKRSSTDVKLRFVPSCLPDDSDSCLDSNSNPSSEMIENFYRCINEKNLEELGSYISEDCVIEDSLFIEPFQGRKEALEFFEELTQSMGRYVKFRILNVYESGTSGAGAIWRLAWKDIEIPFSKGCTFINIRNEKRRAIQKAQIIVEPQVKAGHFILALLKLVTSLLDTFPAIPEFYCRAAKIVSTTLGKVAIKDMYKALHASLGEFSGEPSSL
ncbi:uncharacterized protein LOC111023569 isoform X2 [Momordica charantia]|uniref:Uncharacterized protein LOC111023569 isoform X2 n=1 Tax=Momordica charantia TaxID=3673 RepID=A0A6J1DR56_MOMCH|nr:uncharacterized protein LOC111023569 isoform X2 [Momordica charantia]